MVVASLLLLFFVVQTITSYAIFTIKVTYHDGIATAATVYSVGKDRDDEKIRALPGGFSLVKRDTIAVRAVSDIYATIKDIDTVPNFNIPAVTINIYKDKNATKYSGDSLGCVAYNQAKDLLSSYSCTNPRQVVRYDKPANDPSPRQNRLLATMQPSYASIYSVEPYIDGVLGLSLPGLEANIPTNRFLFMVDSSGVKKEISIPDEIEQRALGSTSVVTDTSSTGGTSFLLVAKTTGDLYFADQAKTGPMSYKKHILPPTEFSAQFDTLSCSLLNATAYCYYGHGSESPDSSDETDHHAQEKPGTIIVVDFAGDTPNVQQYSVDKSVPIDKLFVTQAGLLYTLSADNLIKLNLSGTAVTANTISSDIRSIGAGNGLYFVRDNSVFRIDDKKGESYLVFASKKLRLSNVINLGENVFVNAFVEGMGGLKMHTYELNDEPNDTPGTRLIDILPFSFKESSDINDMDLYKNELDIRLKVTIKKLGRSPGIDSAEFEKAKERVLDLLGSKSVSINDISISFSY